MKNNVGAADRVIRIIIGILAAYGGHAVKGGVLGVILYVVAAIALLTGLFGTCPVYSLLGMSSCPASKK